MHFGVAFGAIHIQKCSADTNIQKFAVKPLNVYPGAYDLCAQLMSCDNRDTIM